MSLKKYLQKRDFIKTSEPKGRAREGSNGSIFVIQKHAASRLHYDFRLEIDNVLKSWTIPKGLPTKPGDKRLAIETEDHPIEYANSEGIIPKGLYGAGVVEVWDKGTFENTTVRNGRLLGIKQAIVEGHLDIYLRGRKVSGEFSLIVFKEDKKQWLMIKEKKSK